GFRFSAFPTLSDPILGPLPVRIRFRIPVGGGSAAIPATCVAVPFGVITTLAEFLSPISGFRNRCIPQACRKRSS
ncbi:hypothetical protein, partial [Streptomyces platensis]|uniref:hypothetical protein n=1 Tax=Streptomyces platensis TaxID=58346 RepID=UPI00332C96DE